MNEELPYNRSLLITNKGWIENTYSYKCPPEFSFRGISVKQVIINNPPNISNHVLTFVAVGRGVNGGDAVSSINIPDTNLLPKAYIEVLRDALKEEIGRFEPVAQNIVGEEDLEEGDDVSVLNGLVKVTSDYYDSTNTFRISITNRSSTVFRLHFNDELTTYLGLENHEKRDPDGYFDIGVSSKIYSIRSNVPANPYPRYYIIRSSSLAGYGFTENDNNQSDIIAIALHNQDASNVTIWENQETHLHTLFFDKGELHHSIDLRFYIEESQIPIQNPSFLISFVTTG